jgi:8-oxo-dGTP pyrophosphatase MutT (NUDIX family)
VNRRVYLTIGRMLSPLFIIGLRIYTFLTRTQRVRVLVVSEHGEVLLVQGVISDGEWTLPGGGIGRGELAQAAARRELYEETGIEANEEDFHYLETLKRPDIKVPFKIPLFLLRVNHSALPRKPANQWEIAAIGWYQPSDLPTPLAILVGVALKRYYPPRNRGGHV